MKPMLAGVDGDLVALVNQRDQVAFIGVMPGLLYKPFHVVNNLYYKENNSDGKKNID